MLKRQSNGIFDSFFTIRTHLDHWPMVKILSIWVRISHSYSNFKLKKSSDSGGYIISLACPFKSWNIQVKNSWHLGGTTLVLYRTVQSVRTDVNVRVCSAFSVNNICVSDTGYYPIYAEQQNRCIKNIVFIIYLYWQSACFFTGMF